MAFLQLTLIIHEAAIDDRAIEPRTAKSPTNPKAAPNADTCGRNNVGFVSQINVASATSNKSSLTDADAASLDHAIRTPRHMFGFMLVPCWRDCCT